MTEKQPDGNRIFVVTVPMEGRSPEEIALDAATQMDVYFNEMISNEKLCPRKEELAHKYL